MPITKLKADPGMQMHQELEIAPESVWHLAHRISEIWDCDNVLFCGHADVT